MQIKIKEKKVIKSFGLLPSTVKKIDEIEESFQKRVSRSEIVEQLINQNPLNYYQYDVQMAFKAESKERPVVVNGKFITPKKTRLYENKVTKFMKSWWMGAPIEKALKVSLVFQFKKPKTGKYDYPPRKDCDNMAKAFLDACNGVTFKDDSQIVELKVTKVYGLDDRIKFYMSEA